MKKLLRLTSMLLCTLLLLLTFGCAAGNANAPVKNEPTANEPAVNEPAADEPPKPAAPIETASSSLDPQNTDASWTVLMYLCGTDLETDNGSATRNLIEAMSAGSVEGVNFIVQTGGTAQWQNDFVDPDAIQRWKLEGDSLTLVDEQTLTSMGDPETLSDFLTWGAANYPAQKTMVLFWDHGGGSASGVTFDELFDDDGLDLSEIAKGLASTGITYELVGFDACLMATYELASLISPMANYMVASEEWEPGSGWDYEALLSYLCENPDADGDALGRAICSSYYQKCDGVGIAPMATLSVIDLAKMPALIESFEAMVAEMTGITDDINMYREFVQGAIRAENYGGNNENEGYSNMVDLGDLAVNTENVLPATADGVLTALFDAVTYMVKGESRSEANGLSVFFPLKNKPNAIEKYVLTAAPSEGYVRFIEAITGVDASADLSVPSIEDMVSSEDYKVEYDTFIDEEGVYNLEITSGIESVSEVLFELYFMDYEYNEYMLMGCDNDIVGDWETGSFKDNFRGVWPTINGNYVSLTLIAECDDYYLYSIPILLNGVKTSLRAAYEFDEAGDGEFVVYGMWNGISETGASSREITKLKDGDEVTLLFDCVNWDTGETTTYEISSFTVDGPVIMEESELLDGDYAYGYTIKNVFGQEYYTPMAIMECKDGEIYVSEAE